MSDAEPATRAAEVKRWLADIETARKREKSYRDEGKRIMSIYEGEKSEEVPFNILYSNTAILSPALYGNLPRPLVQRRFKSDDALGKAASEASTRMLSFLLDTNSDKYEDFDSTTKETVLDACLPGRGSMELCYEADIVKVPVEGRAEPSEQINYECVYTEHSIWNRWVPGFAKKWQDVPWLSFELYFDKDEARKEFGEVADLLKYVSEGEEDEGKKDSTEKQSDRKVARVFKVWDKKGRRLLFIASGQDDYLKEEEDPYELTGFFPVPRPLRLLPKSGNLLPSALYLLYENQAKELNKLTIRINKLIEMLKVRGVYDASITGIEQALKSEDGDLTASNEPTTMSREGGLEKHIWLMPIDKIAAVVQQLYLSREQCKRVIYEITGLSDIMRGATQASETLGAQELKSQYGSLRLKDMQKEVQRYARDAMRIMLEIAVRKFQPETWIKVTGLKFLTDQQAAAVAQAVQQAQMQAVVAQQSGQPAPPPDPAIAQAMQTPKWSDVLGLLKDTLAREYRVDVETNSTIDPDASEQKKNLAEMMNAIAQFLNGVGPMIKEGAMSIDVAKAILLGITRQYEMGSEVEDLIRNMQLPPKPQEQDKTKETALAGQLQKSELEKQGLAQENAAQKRDAQLGLREAELKNREAALQAKEELFRIQADATRTGMANDHKTNIAQHKQVGDQALAKVQKVADQITATIASDTKARALEKQASDKVAAEKEKSAAKGAGMEGLIKELHTAVQALTKATLTPRERKLVKDKAGKTIGMVETPAGG